MRVVNRDRHQGQSHRRVRSRQTREVHACPVEMFKHRVVQGSIRAKSTPEPPNKQDLCLFQSEKSANVWKVVGGRGTRRLVLIAKETAQNQGRI